MRYRIRYLEKLSMWILAFVMVMPNLLNLFGELSASAAVSEGQVQTVLYEGPDGTASVDASLNADGTAVNWIVTLNKHGSDTETTQQIAMDLTGGGLSKPNSVSAGTVVEAKPESGEVYLLRNEPYTKEAQSGKITFTTDVVEEGRTELSLKMLVETVTADKAGEENLAKSANTKTIRITLPAPAVVESAATEVEESPSPTLEPVPESQPPAKVEEPATAPPVAVESEEPVAEEASSEMPAEKPAEQTADQPTEQPAEQPTEQPVTESVKESEEAVVEKQPEEEKVLEAGKPAEDSNEPTPTVDPEDPIALVPTTPISWSPVPQYTTVGKAVNARALRALAPTPAYTNNPTLGTSPTNFTQNGSHVRNYNPQLWEYEDSFLTKYATETATPGKFDINLKIEGKTITSTQTIDIVLVYDNSNSMDDVAGRFNSAKNATTSFINSLLNTTTNASGNIRIALVTFGTGLINGNSNYSFTTNAQTLIGRLPTSANGGGTNTQAGLMRAAEIMAGSTAQTKVVVVISDGVPTYSYRATSSVANNSSADIMAYNTITPPNRRGTAFDTVIGNGSSFDLSRSDDYTINGYSVVDNGWGTMSQAVLMKKAGLEIYGLGIQITSGADATQNEALYVMKNIASPGKFYNASQVSEISDLLADIGTQISKSIINGSVEDPMGDMVLLSKGSDNIFNTGDYILTGSLGLNLSGVTVSADANGKVTINNLNLGANEWVNLKYSVNVKTEDANFKPGFYYQTNGNATLTPKAINPNVKRAFPIPSVKAEGTSISGKKTWENDMPADRPQSISLQLKRHIQGSNPSTAVNVGNPITTTAQNNWMYDFGIKPAFNNSGQLYTYFVSEPTVPSGYVKTEAGYNVTNRLLAASLEVKKVREDETPITGNGMQAEFTLYRDNVAVQTILTNSQTGIAAFSGIKVGTYTLKETKAPTGYVADPATYTVTVTQQGASLNITVTAPDNQTPLPSSPLLIKNSKKIIDIPVSKAWEDNNDTLGLRPDEITIELYQDYAEGKDPFRTVKLNVDGNWEGTFAGIPQYDDDGKEYNYTIKEVPVAYYESNVDGFTIYNRVQVGTLTITKVDGSLSGENRFLTGAEFELHHGDGTVVKDADGNPLQGTTGEDGKLTFTNVPYGSYVLVETKAPEGYNLPDKDWEIEIGGENKQQVVIEVPNTKRATLPETGGMGTTLFTLIGLSMMGISTFLFRKNNHKNDQKSQGGSKDE